MKLGSLFDGSGGFPLAGMMCGHNPVWAAEVKPYPIAVTRQNIPGMLHLGDVSKINGAEIEPVDIITFGSPCQDMSIAGNRAGMQHADKGDEDTTRSGLFYEAVRIIKEMRAATNGKYPRYIIWENVHGAYSSQKGEDFRAVLEAICSVCDNSVSIPRPAKKWLNAGQIMGDTYSVAWRTFDAQYWGVPQRRRRIYLVADFTGQRAEEILFKRQGLRWDFAQGGETRETVARDAAGSIAGGCSDGGGCLTPWDRQLNRIYTIDGIYPTLAAPTGTNNQAVLISKDSLPVYALQGNSIDRADTASCNGAGWREEQSYTLNTVDRHAVAFMARQSAQAGSLGESELVAPTMRQSQSPCVCVLPKNDKCYTIDPLSSNSMKSSNPRSGFHETDIARCLDSSSGSPSCNQGGNVIIQKRRKWIVRRLTPTECARLQGFPDNWGVLQPIETMTDKDVEFWNSVRKTDAEINGKKYKPMTKGQTIRWYNKLHTDSAEYQMWGNGIALPCALYVMQGI